MQSFSGFGTTNWASFDRLAFLLTGTAADADDVLQAVLERTWGNWDRVQRTAEPVAYVRRSVYNACMDVHRATRRSQDLSQRLDGHADVHLWEQQMLDRDAVWRAVQKLPVRQRAVVVLRYWSDLSEREIAATLGCRPGTVKSQASAAMQTLRESLGELELEQRES